MAHLRSLHALMPEDVLQIRTKLLEWYAQNARILPWRLPSQPYDREIYQDYVQRLYQCLLSETMLQQTQVKTVIDYYTKWLIKFPTIRALADANEEDVMACWAGLGYYSRAKRLHQAAQYLVSNFVSKELEFPRDPEYWVKNVPGVGPYTAGAILSISFGIPSAIVDGNVQRVLSRVLAIHGDTSTPKSAGSKLIWERAAELVQGIEPGNLNQSLMELGATVCTPTQPDCSKCPIKDNCVAYRQLRELKSSSKNFFHASGPSADKVIETVADVEDLCVICPASVNTAVVTDRTDTYIQGLYPFKPQRKKQREECAIVLVIKKYDKVYLEKKAKGLLAGLYDFPTTLLETIDEDGIEAVIARHKSKLDAVLSGTTVHLFSHIRRTSHVLTCQADKASKALDTFARANETGKWVAINQLEDVAVSELCLKNWRTTIGASKPSKRATERTQGGPQKKRIKRNSADQASEHEPLARPAVTEVLQPDKTRTQATKHERAAAVDPPIPPTAAHPSGARKAAKQSTIFAMFSRPRAKIA